jgi:hypothetical protein
MRLTPIPVTLFVLGALNACGSSRDSASNGSSNGDSVAATEGHANGAAPAANGSAAVAVRVKLTGGKNAGTYEAQTSDATCLDYGPLGLGVAYFPTTEAKGISFVDFGAKAKRATGTEDFEIRIGIRDDDPMPAEYRVGPKKQWGPGTAKVTGATPRYTIEVTGKSADDGSDVEATIRCLK